MNNGIKPLNLYPQVAMKSDIARLLTAIMFQKGLGTNICEDLEAKKVFHHMIGLKRAEILQIKIDNDVRAMITLLSNGPGAVVMYLHAVHQRQLSLAHRGEDRNLTIQDFCEMFAEGFPDEETMERAWDAQKDDNGHNRVDTDAFNLPYSPTA